MEWESWDPCDEKSQSFRGSKPIYKVIKQISITLSYVLGFLLVPWSPCHGSDQSCHFLKLQGAELKKKN